ncbi:sodium:solute symporter family transporter [Aneurinibacillus sp. REN35]|uniref:sodium:solute symporter family transporter n=1 Tax=Aneurinibacillus sp. REN35 TaxID=3237286 RepID=UPI00352759FB
MNLGISSIDLAIIVLYIIGTLFIGWYVSKRVSGYEDFSIGGRSFGPFILAATFGATNFSTWSLVGKPGMVYGSGISVVWLAWNAMACVAAAVFFIPIYRKLRYHTMSEIFEDRYNGVNRGLISILWILADTFNRYGVTVFASALILSLILDVSVNYMILLMAVLVLALTFIGGIVSVVITDAIQFVLMWAGLFIGSIYILSHFNGLSGLVESVPANLVDWVPSAASATGWPWIIALTVLGFPYFITSQFVMQRGLGAKTVNVARWGMLFAAVLAIPMAIMEIIPGLAARVMLDPETVKNMNPDMIGPEIYLQLLPVGAVGIFFSSLLAAGMSTADSALCGASSLFTEDFYKKARPNLSEKHYLKVTRMATIVLCVIGTAWAFLVPKLGGVINSILTIIAITDMPIFIIICLAVFWRKMNAKGALAAILSGTIAGGIVSSVGMGVGGIQNLAITTATSTLTALTMGIIISLVTSRNTVEQKRVDNFFSKLSAADKEL